jgi:hypothetical protein
MAEAKIVPHQSFAPTLRQYEEGRRYEAAGGLCCLIGWRKLDKKMYIAEWGKVAKIEASFHSNNGNHAEQLLEWLKSTFIRQDTKRFTLKENSKESTE